MMCSGQTSRLLMLVFLQGVVFEWPETEGKTLQGVFTTEAAKRTRGQYLGTFCFHGDKAEVQYSINSTGFAPVSIYLFLDEDWQEARDDPGCYNKFNMARLIQEINKTSDNFTVAHFMRPRLWHLVLADVYTCDPNRPISTLERANYVRYEIKLLNPDILGNPTDHFSDEDTGLYRFYQLLTLVYFILACIYGPRLSETLQKHGPMHLVIQLLTGAMILQAVGAILMMMHLRAYSKDGIGSPASELLSEFFDVLSQFVMLYMLLSLSMGWTLAGTHKPIHLLSHLQDKPAAKVVSIIGILQAMLFLWEQYEEREHRMYHAHRSWAGLFLVSGRIVLAGGFALNLYSTVNMERSNLKREFYSNFMKSCMLWFLCYPVMVMTSLLFPPYLRYKFVTMSVVFCQSIVVVMLYRLFLSRSLYWEVSALSSSLLPLRLDKSFRMKAYS